MAPTGSSDTNTWAVQHVLALVEIWALVAQHSGFVGAWRLLAVCRAARAGAKEWLGALPGVVVCGGTDGWDHSLSKVHSSSKVWRLDLATLRWGPMPALVVARYGHACCTVRGALIVLGGFTEDIEGEEVIISSVEILSERSGDGVFTALPPLSCGGIARAAAIAVEENDSAAGQVLLLGGCDGEWASLSTVHLVDLATGVCTPQPALFNSPRRGCACCPRRFAGGFPAVRIPDGRNHLLRGRHHQHTCVGGSVGSTDKWKWSVECRMDLDRAARDECSATCLLRMRDE
jgi:hypothetical protein